MNSTYSVQKMHFRLNYRCEILSTVKISVVFQIISNIREWYIPMMLFTVLFLFARN